MEYVFSSIFKLLVVLFLLIFRKLIYISKVMGNFLFVSIVNFIFVRENINRVDVWKIFSCYMYDIVNFILYLEDINKDIFEVFFLYYIDVFLIYF